MHSCTYDVSNIIKAAAAVEKCLKKKKIFFRRVRRIYVLLKGKAQIIRAKNECANIKWCENMMTAWSGGLSQVYFVERRDEAAAEKRDNERLYNNIYSGTAHVQNCVNEKKKMIKNQLWTVLSARSKRQCILSLFKWIEWRNCHGMKKKKNKTLIHCFKVLREESFKNLFKWLVGMILIEKWLEIFFLLSRYEVLNLSMKLELPQRYLCRYVKELSFFFKQLTRSSSLTLVIAENEG